MAKKRTEQHVSASFIEGQVEIRGWSDWQQRDHDIFDRVLPVRPEGRMIYDCLPSAEIVSQETA